MPLNTQLAAPPRIGAITPRHSWPIFGNTAGELNSAQRTTPSLLRTPVTVIDNLPAGCDRLAVSGNMKANAASAAVIARNFIKAPPNRRTPSHKSSGEAPAKTLSLVL